MKRIAAVVVDEAHCIREWGDKIAGFRPLVACSATIDTETFDFLWRTLQFGSRPFFGVDVGASRPDLTYIIRKIRYATNPAKDLGLRVLSQRLL